MTKVSDILLTDEYNNGSYLTKYLNYYEFSDDQI